MTEQLLGALKARANRRGLVLARADRLADELGCSPEELTVALDALGVSDKLEILAPAPYLVLALLPRSCPGRKLVRARNPPHSKRIPRPSQEEVPVSSSEAAAAVTKEEGGAGEGGALLAEALATLGPKTDRAELGSLLATHTPSLVRRCLRRVATTPRIRVSRLALFRALLKRLSA